MTITTRRRRFKPGLLGLVGLTGLLFGCAIEVSFQEVESSFRGQGVRTLTFEEGFTLSSPYDSQRTAELSNTITKNLSVVRELFEVRLQEPILVTLEPLEMERSEEEHESGFKVSTFQRPTKCGIVGGAGTVAGTNRPAVTLFVAKDLPRDERHLTTMIKFNYEDTIRHELAHVCARLAGLVGPVWFNEGLAEEVESMRLRPTHSRGRYGLRRVRQPQNLEIAKAVHENYRLVDILDWKENVAKIAAGEEEPFFDGRPLAHSFLRFLLSRFELPFLEGVRKIHGMTREELLAWEDAWHAWLDPQSTETWALQGQPAGP